MRRRSWLTYCSFDAHGDAKRPTMDAAFLVLWLLPPPTPGANILAGFNGARARRTADAGIAAIVQRIVGNAVPAQILPDVGVDPVGERIELPQPVRLIEFLHRHIRSRRRLRAALSRDPGAASRERAHQRRGLANRAAMLTQLDTAIKRIGAMLANERLQRMMIGKEDIDRQLIVLAHAIDQGVGLGRKPPGVQRENPDRQRVTRDEIGQYHVLGAKTAGERRRGMARRNPMEQGKRFFALAFEIHRRIHAGSTPPSLASRLRNSGTGRSTVVW